MIVLTHGTSVEGKTSDELIPTHNFWIPFTPDKAPSLVGIPKLFLVEVLIFFLKK